MPCFLRFLGIFIVYCYFAIALSLCVYANFVHLLTHPMLWVLEGKKDAAGYLLGNNYNQMGCRMMIAAPVFTLAKSARIGLTNCWIPVASALLIWLVGVNPIYVLVVAGMCGYLYGLLIKPTE